MTAGPSRTSGAEFGLADRDSNRNLYQLAGGLAVFGKMRGIQVAVEICRALPDFGEEEMGGIVNVAKCVVRKIASLAAARPDQALNVIPHLVGVVFFRGHLRDHIDVLLAH